MWPFIRTLIELRLRQLGRPERRVIQEIIRQVYFPGELK